MLTGPFIPIFDDHDDGFSGGPRHYRRYDPMATRRAYNEEARRAEIERYNRMREHQLRQQREEELRRKREQEAYLKRLREAEEQERLRRQCIRAAEAARRHQRYTIVRGRDGYLYRVPVDYEEEDDLQKMTNMTQEDDLRKMTNKTLPGRKKRRQGPRFVRGPHGRIYAIHDSSDDEPMDRDGDMQKENTDAMRLSPTPSPTAPEAELEERFYDTMETERVEKLKTTAAELKQRVADRMDTEPVETFKKTATKKKRPRRRVNVTIEDASDSEDEDEMKSVWRHRRPGPGESWMEPIAAP